MRTQQLVLFSGLTFLMRFGAESATTETSGVAVIEVFTSEGCSSCPPAEAMMKTENLISPHCRLGNTH